MDSRKSFMVHGATYRREMFRQKPVSLWWPTMITDIVAAIAMFAFLAGAGFWITVVLA